MWTQRIVITDQAQLKAHHFAAKRIVIHERESSWTRYIVLDRRRIVARIRKAREQGAKRWQLDQIARPDWSETYNGPGQHFRHMPWQLVRSSTGRRLGKRFIVICQSGGIDC